MERLVSVQPYGRPGDRRTYPRITCSLECTIFGVGEARILNVSVGGAFVAVGYALEPTHAGVRMCFAPDGNSPITVDARIARRVPIAPHGMGLGVEFSGLDEQSTRRLHALVLSHLLADISDAVARDATIPPGSLEVISGPTNVARELKSILSSDLDVLGVIFQRESSDLVEVRLRVATPQRLTVELERADAAGVSVGDLVHLTFNRGHNHIHLHTQVLDRNGASVTLEVPPTLTIFQLRQAPRTKTKPGQMFVEVPLPYPPGKRMRREVLDVSSTGLAFKVRPGEAYFLPGTPLREIVVTNIEDDNGYRKSAQVMHVTPVQNPDGTVEYLKIGVAFGIQDANVKRGVRPRAPGARKGGTVSFLSKMSKLIGQIIPRRSSQRSLPAGPGNLVEVVRYPNRHRQEIVAIVNTTRREPGRRLQGPVVIIPPAHGKRKESTSGLALTLVENFARRRRDVVVVRYDGINNLGESYRDPECRKPGDEALHMTLSQSVDDIEATVDWVYDNPMFTPTEVILVSFSLQGVMGRRAVFRDRGRRIHYWIGVTGAPAAQEVIRNATGGIDYIAEYAATGKTVARAAVLGVEIEGMRFCEDLLRNGLAFMSDAKREIAEIPIPVTWVLGLYDAWIDPSTIREFMAVKARAPRELIELECGHVPLNSDEALKLFSVIMQAVWRQLYDEDIEPVFPNLREFLRTRSAEWRRIPKSPIPDKRNYWHEYLLGSADRRISYDVLNSAEEYIAFLDREADLLGLKAGHRLADMGCGTGNFFARLVRRKGGRGRPLCKHLTLVDFVPTALEAASNKLDKLADRYGEAVPRRDTTCLNLELSPLRTVRAFLSGTYYGYDPLKGTIRGLTDYSIDMWKAVEDWRLHDIVRGRNLDDEDRWFLRDNFPEDEQDVIVDMNRLTRFLKGNFGPDDLTREGRMMAARGRTVGVEHLQFKRLDPLSHGAIEHLPFEDGQFDRILSSLVLSYVNNPLETLREFHRCLAPGGRLVVSSMRPDVDMSRIYRNLMIKLERGHDTELPEGMTREVFVEEVRHYVNSAAFLLKLAEEGQFVFFSRDEMRRLVERAGFRRVEVFASFGRPAQALITVGYR